MEFEFDSGGSKSMTMNDEESKLMDEISFEMPARKVVPLRAKVARASPFSKTSVGPRMPQESQADEGLDMFMNPGKRSAPPPPEPEEYDGGEEDMGEEGMGEENQGGGGGSSMPSDGYKTIEDEKADLLNKITRLISKGIKSSARLTIYSDIDEIRTEYKRMTYGIEVERSIKFQRRAMIAMITGIEFLNEKFDPFDIELNGWSQSSMENVEDYDGVFEELHNKYKAKINVAPEVKLIMMVGGSAMMFHLTNSMFKAAVPNVSEVMKQNPDLMRNMMDAVQRTNTTERPEPGLKRDMKGPGMDFGSLMGMMGPPQPQQTRPGRAESISDIVSIDAGDSDTREIIIDGRKKRAPKKSKKEVSF